MKDIDIKFKIFDLDNADFLQGHAYCPIKQAIRKVDSDYNK